MSPSDEQFKDAMRGTDQQIKEIFDRLEKEEKDKKKDGDKKE